MIRLNSIPCMVSLVATAAIFAPTLAHAAAADSFYCQLTATDNSVTPAKVISNTTGRFDVLRRPDLSSPTSRRLTTNASSRVSFSLPDSTTIGFSLNYSHMTNELRTVGLQKSCVIENICSFEGPEDGGQQTCRISSCGPRKDPDGNPTESPDWKNVGVEDGIPRFDPTGVFPATLTYQNYSRGWNCRHTATVAGE